jgi:hypothetical protein
MTDRPIGVGETSCPSKGGDKAQWILDAFDTIANEFTHMTEVSCYYYTMHPHILLQHYWTLLSPWYAVMSTLYV